MRAANIESRLVGLLAVGAIACGQASSNTSAEPPASATIAITHVFVSGDRIVLQRTENQPAIVERPNVDVNGLQIGQTSSAVTGVDTLCGTTLGAQWLNMNFWPKPTIIWDNQNCNVGPHFTILCVWKDENPQAALELTRVTYICGNQNGCGQGGDTWGSGRAQCVSGNGYSGTIKYATSDCNAANFVAGGASIALNNMNCQQPLPWSLINLP